MRYNGAVARRIFITVGEVSGDNHAAGLVASLKRLDPSIQIDALGGPRMAAAGAVIHHETTRKAAMTFHALKRVNEIRRLEAWLRARYASADRPALHICVDSSGFNLRFARLAKQAGVPVLYYVAPQLWASRESRIKQVRACVDQLACIFPFEEKWFRDRGVNATFVGHPLFDHLPADRFDRIPKIRYPDRAPVIGVVAGSRRAEVRENFPPLLQVMRAIAQQHPQARFLLPKAAYTKVLHTYHAGARVIRYAAYDGADTYVEASTLDGRRLLWADFVVDRLVRVIRLRRTGTFGTGPLAVTYAREQVLERIVSVYDALRNATLLKQRLEALVDGTGDPDDATQNFLKHRNPLTALVADEAPKKARLIRELLAVYPV